jgi:TPR repeat protein
MVALDQIQDVLIPGRAEESADRVPLLRAVADWYRVDMPVLLTRRVLEDLYVAYRSELAGQNHNRPVSATRFARALAWASASGSRRRPQLVDLARSGRNSWYAPHPLLPAVADDTGQPGAWPVGAALWEYADRVLKGDQRRDIGYAALEWGAFPHARRLLGHDDTRIDPAAMRQVAYWLHRTGNATAARDWYTRIIATGHTDHAPHAMFNFGVLEYERGDLEQARHWYGEAIATGHADAAPPAMFNLGNLEHQHGDLAQARRRWEQAIATGHPEAAARARRAIRDLERREGERRRAEHFRRYGWQAYADPQLMKPGSIRSDSDQPAGDEDEPLQ